MFPGSRGASFSFSSSLGVQLGGRVPSSPQLLGGSLHSEGQHPDEGPAGGPVMKGPSLLPWLLPQVPGNTASGTPQNPHTLQVSLGLLHYLCPKHYAGGANCSRHSWTSGSLRCSQGDWKVQQINAKQMIHQKKKKDTQRGE